jgi:hypothetical protein
MKHYGISPPKTSIKNTLRKIIDTTIFSNFVHADEIFHSILIRIIDPIKRKNKNVFTASIVNDSIIFI